MEVTKIFTFDSSHRLLNKKWDDEKNRVVFDKCNNFPSHGHLFVLHVTVEGPIDEDTGMVVNFVGLKRLVTVEVIDKLDHHFINTIEGFDDVIPTCENLLEKIGSILKGKLEDPIKLRKLTLYETPTSYATRYF